MELLDLVYYDKVIVPEHMGKVVRRMVVDRDAKRMDPRLARLHERLARIGTLIAAFVVRPAV